MSLSIEKLFVRDYERKDGSVLTINQCEIGDVGCVVWDAAIVLASYLQTDDFADDQTGNRLRGKRVVELGAGTGLVGLQAAAEGAEVTLTDLEDFIPLLEKNIAVNRHVVGESVDACTLRWGGDVTRFLPSPDYILLADCIYYDESLEPLVMTMHELSGPDTCILCCYEERQTEHKIALEKQFHQLVSQYFTADTIPMHRQDTVYRCEDIHIYELRKKKKQ